jgi:hypothetical protein
MIYRKLRILLAAAGLAALAAPASAHCDGLDGPVVAAARKALDSGDANPVLIWVQPRDEAAIREAFREALAVRRLGPAARDMADRYFYETLVRLHRSGEGAPYTGLQPAGRDLGPAIPLADRAIASGSDREIAAFIAKEAAKAVHERFADLQRKRSFAPDDLPAGRAYVESYVAFVHLVEAIHQATKPASGHYREDHEGAPAETDHGRHVGR